MSSQYPALEWISLRHDGHSAALIAQRAGVSAESVRRATRDSGPYPRPSRQLGRNTATADAVNARTARWVKLRQEGVRTTDIASREGVSHRIVSRATKAHGPYPTPHPSAEVVSSWVADRRAGIASDVIAKAAGATPLAVRRAVKPHGPFPGSGSRIPAGFLGTSGAARLLGVSHPTILRWQKAGFLPDPDVVTGSGRRLWREDSLASWLSTASLQKCPRCGARLRRPRAHLSQTRCGDSPA